MKEVFEIVAGMILMSFVSPKDGMRQYRSVQAFEEVLFIHEKKVFASEKGWHDLLNIVSSMYK